MKTKNIFLGLVAIGALYFSACQKSLTFEDTPPNVIDSTANPDSNYLSRVFSYDTAYNDPQNPTVATIDSSMLKYYYDSQKRLIKITGADVATPNVDIFTLVKLFYNQNDSLPFRARTEANDTTDYYLFYNTNGKLLKDSVIANYISNSVLIHTLRITDYSYSAGFMYKNYTSTNFTSPFFSFAGRDTSILDSRGNVTSGTTYFKLNSQSAFSLQSKTFNTYDNNPSQLTKLPGLKPFYTAYSNGFAVNFSEIGNNNTLTNKVYNYSYNGTTTPTLTDSLIRTDILVYKQNGYPSSIKSILKSNLATVYKSKANLFYTVL
jgi:hypothetical protein